MNRLLPHAVLLALFTGCWSSHESATPQVQIPTSANETVGIKRFTIGDTEFGIDATVSSFAIDVSDAVRPTIAIDITGDRSTFDPLTVDDDSEWSWALDPPAFYLREFPVRIDASSGIVSAHVIGGDVEDYEFSIYMMEHNNIQEMDVEVVPNKSVAISGRVDLLGDVREFTIEWQREDAK